MELCTKCKKEPRQGEHRWGSECRSRWRRKRLYPKCKSCLEHRQTRTKDRVCDRCLADQGLKWCRECKDILVESICFYRHHRRCKGCEKKIIARRTARRLA